MARFISRVGFRLDTNRFKGKGKSTGKSFYRGGKGRSWQKTTYMVEEKPWEYDDSYEPEAKIEEEEGRRRPARRRVC